MAKDYMGYDILTDDALRGVVKEALKRTAKQGLLAGHHFYVTFKTHDDGVEIPDFLKERYPDEMTIVLQNQYWGLKVHDDHFEVGLSFQKMPTTLVIPFAALTAFVDPGVQFGLQFRNSSAAQAPAQGQSQPQNQAQTPPQAPSKLADKRAEKPASPPQETKSPPAEDGAETSSPQVVSLDKFRKK